MTTTTDLPAVPAGLTARRPTEADHARVQATLGDWWGHLGGEFGDLQRALLLPRLFFQHMTDTSALVEDADGRVVAFLVGFLSPARPGTAYIHFVGIDPAARGGGLGRRLYEWFFALAADRDAREVRCITGPANRASVAFHTRMGFALEPGDREVDDIPVHSDYDGPGLDRVSFVRPLP
ncbi:GNAT family N-acetyltransferase [Trujillonella endophytica]|uniref:Acetyltransferase (GNAT) family protein n=1 Tax=Trujillonella endophytica TaxID=673521 RepID=A0A1H8V315_9ACTN|nr:GNAT family N-acetyltransferase [Trujillella endophytica]SEP09624.1 Acetyltransferase (GNAT) family protein [Trujillella endophytica]